MELSQLAQFGLPGLVLGGIFYVCHTFMTKGYTLKIELGPRKK
jgi:hypothetical protein